MNNAVMIGRAQLFYEIEFTKYSDSAVSFAEKA